MNYRNRLRLHRIAIALLLGALIAVSVGYFQQRTALRRLQRHHAARHVSPDVVRVPAQWCVPPDHAVDWDSADALRDGMPSSASAELFCTPPCAATQPEAR